MSALRSIFIALSHNRTLRGFAERSAAGRRASSRFVAGLTIDRAVEAVGRLNSERIAATLDALGENVTTEEQAHASAGIYHDLLDAIDKNHLNANISVKLTQMGIDLADAPAAELVTSLVDHAARTNNFIRIDMEGSRYTKATLDMVRTVHAKQTERGHIGVVIQAYLRRSAKDVETLAQEGVPIRLVKGAYKEPPEIAFESKRDVDASYLRLAGLLLTSGTHPAIATHDAAILGAIKKFATVHDIPKQSFEFQMLYGIRRDLQRRLVDEGYNVRVYVPFGADWYPYFMRRLAERPANALFLARNLFRR